MRGCPLPVRSLLRFPGFFLALLAPAALGLLPCFAQQMHRNRFESDATSWLKGSADAAYSEVAHQMSDKGAHDGQRSEYLQINAGQGTLGQLIVNPQMYDALTGATREFQGLAKDIRTNPKKFLSIRLTLF